MHNKRGGKAGRKGGIIDKEYGRNIDATEVVVGTEVTQGGRWNPFSTGGMRGIDEKVREEAAFFRTLARTSLAESVQNCSWRAVL